MRASVLIERRHKLEQLVADLTAEIRFLDKELAAIGKAARVPLTSRFFRDEVTPILKKAGPIGLTAGELRAALKTAGFDVPAPAFRVFLTRRKQRGELALSITSGKAGRWQLPRKSAESNQEQVRQVEMQSPIG